MEKKKFSVYKLLTNLAIVGLFLGVGLFVLSVMGMLKFSAGMTTFIAIVMIVCGCALMMLPWVKNLEDKRLRVLSWVFVGVTVACGILWIVSALIIIRAASGKADMGLGTLQFLKVALIITIQFLVATNIASTIAKYKKSLIPFQVIYYASLLFVDFFITCLMMCLKLYPEVGFNFGAIKIVFNKVTVTFFVLALMYVLISKSIIKSVDRKRAKNSIDVLFDAGKVVSAFGSDARGETEDSSSEAKLKKLKEMRDNNLITEEEYQAKRKQIIDLM